MSSENIPSWVNDFEVVYGEDQENLELTDFAKLMEDSKQSSFQEGEVYEGQVVSVTDDFVTVDIGYKQEGLVFAKEFRNYDGTLKCKEGDKIEVFEVKEVARFL